MTRWNYKLDTYDFEIQHRPGVQHLNADAMSRITRKCARPDCPECSVLRESPAKTCPGTEIKEFEEFGLDDELTYAIIDAELGYDSICYG